MNPEYQNVCFKLEEFELPPTFAIITAHNPDGLTQSDPANQDADEALRLLIAATEGRRGQEGRRGHVITFVVASNQSVMELEKGSFRELKRGHSVPLYILFPWL